MLTLSALQNDIVSSHNPSRKLRLYQSNEGDALQSLRAH
jgi:hypothetical protein